MNKHMCFDDIKADLAKLYADAYTQSELKAMVARESQRIQSLQAK
jgi:hypothetical protein